MQWYSRISRFGDIHMVYGQKWANSCGLASTVMCAFKTNKFAPGKQAVYEEQKIKDEYSKVIGSTYDPATQYTFSDKLAKVLKTVTGKDWVDECPSDATQVATILANVDSYSALSIGPTMSSKCCLLLADWGNGAHWVVVDSVRTLLGFHWGTICDPWDTNLHIVRMTKGKATEYDASDVVAGVDIGSSGSQATGAAVTGGVATRTGTYSSKGVITWIVHPA